MSSSSRSLFIRSWRLGLGLGFGLVLELGTRFGSVDPLGYCPFSQSDSELNAYYRRGLV